MITKKTAFCSKSTCCPEIIINTEDNTATITDDFEGMVTLRRGLFLSANFFAKKLNEKRLDISASATFYELEYTISIANRDEIYFISLEYQGQKVRDITLEQWNVLVDAVYESLEPVPFVIPEDLSLIEKADLLKVERISVFREKS